MDFQTLLSVVLNLLIQVGALQAVGVLMAIGLFIFFFKYLFR
jgi:hypothetical protein